ncbi:hypothetical protein K504DRAFT_57185 [Pleomassaria siparia CBS 279.74]|uniref:Uncharacterized protein n=1 Tax=Pleomassaria siparia CBS 279.74 TaxID=1314801 RepID=A0A6G1K4H1_9PLEO|nr:hypothetical protein K504DRAFT_57185 [Pleomassaria siparia CBS 279.74]
MLWATGPSPIGCMAPLRGSERRMMPLFTHSRDPSHLLLSQLLTASYSANATMWYDFPRVLVWLPHGAAIIHRHPPPPPPPASNPPTYRLVL